MTQARQIEQLSAIVPEHLAGRRLDQILAILFNDYSRARLQQLIKEKHVLVDNEQRKAKDKLMGGEQIQLDVVIIEQEAWTAENIALDVIYEDESIIVINKPVGLVVHPAPGNYNGTLVNALLYHYPELSLVPRAGVVHRLDKDTSGLLVVARTVQAQTQLVQQLQNRTVRKEYITLVHGEIVAGGTIEAAIGRDPKNRLKMAVVNGAKEAITHYSIDKKYKDFTLLKVAIITGRTHQIRVHMKSINHAVVGDTVYSGRVRIPAGSSDVLREKLSDFKRQALHAYQLEIIHPALQSAMSWTCPLAKDIEEICLLLDVENKHDN
ncbi:Ribosomal large subunit pseudouridine synthase D [hydrothermal vent metagenome]|uniref:Ribosomal large subunit pseudouridine synthase D n=1 Tax=hydrothermal vent metagenome TaxID=652676 RepID=A0A3B1AGK2_9ZZZZ